MDIEFQKLLVTVRSKLTRRDLTKRSTHNRLKLRGVVRRQVEKIRWQFQNCVVVVVMEAELFHTWQEELLSSFSHRCFSHRHLGTLKNTSIHMKGAQINPHVPTSSYSDKDVGQVIKPWDSDLRDHPRLVQLLGAQS